MKTFPLLRFFFLFGVKPECYSFCSRCWCGLCQSQKVFLESVSGWFPDWYEVVHGMARRAHKTFESECEKRLTVWTANCRIILHSVQPSNRPTFLNIQQIPTWLCPITLFKVQHLFYFLYCFYLPRSKTYNFLFFCFPFHLFIWLFSGVTGGYCAVSYILIHSQPIGFVASFLILFIYLYCTVVWRIPSVPCYIPF